MILPGRRRVAFDLGGVLYDTEPLRFAEAAERAFGCSAEQLSTLTFASGLWTRVEVGLLDGQGFLRELLAGLGVSAQPATLDTLHQAWLSILQLRPGVAGLLDRLQVPSVAWSNTDPLHGAAIRGDVVLGPRMGGWYFSCELGVEKPAASFYQRALAQMRCSSTQVVFVDDRADNVAAARALGIDAFLATSLAGIETGLAVRGLI